jgi:hypothetical protein
MTDCQAMSFAKASCNDRRGYCWLPPKDFALLVLISMLFVGDERELCRLSRLARLCGWRTYSPSVSFNQKEMRSHGAGSVAAKKAAGFKEPCGFY